eukprot:TRINITY_DN3967_c0_g1_i4.p2 TRINITY_DN3967_c0_g1~~TRINITY_DN3967_c0_g1_i4.p2  ORF type:complete len:261 (+),score=59.06 TRINITY_DN3967_c0_g1_i4:222-1004(+)
MAADVGEDLFELRRLLGEAKRPRVRQMLSDEIENLSKSQLGTAEVVPPTPIAAEQHTVAERPRAAALSQSLKQQPVKTVPLPAATSALGTEVRYTTLSTFSWDQTSDKVKIYYPLEGASEDKVSASLGSTAFDIKIHDVNGKNYKCAIPRLNKSISPGKSKVLVKPKRIIVSLEKSETGNWLDLQKKDDKLKSALDKDDKDPMAGIMDLMKNMYEDGDDNMKRTIAQAWTEARTGNKSKPKTPTLGKKYPGFDDNLDDDL